jgi:hypothetical protein
VNQEVAFQVGTVRTLLGAAGGIAHQLGALDGQSLAVNTLSPFSAYRFPHSCVLYSLQALGSRARLALKEVRLSNGRMHYEGAPGFGPRTRQTVLRHAVRFPLVRRVG